MCWNTTILLRKHLLDLSGIVTVGVSLHIDYCVHTPGCYAYTCMMCLTLCCCAHALLCAHLIAMCMSVCWLHSTVHAPNVGPEGMHRARTLRSQVLLYAMEDFSFADFIHLAVYHRRDMFAASPVGISPRTWNPDSFLNPVLSTPHQRLSDPEFPARNLRASRASRRGPDLVLATQSAGENDDEAERLRCIKIPEMVKWAKLLEHGGMG